MKTTKCILCGTEDRKMRGKYCHPCDYKRNKVTGLFTSKDFTGDNQQPSAENDIKVTAKVQRLDIEESTNNISTSARHAISKLSHDDIVRAIDITKNETIESMDKEPLR